MISFYILNEYKSNSPWFWLIRRRVSIYDLPNKNNLRASTAGLVFSGDAFISHNHSAETTKIGLIFVIIISSQPFLASYYMISNLKMRIIYVYFKPRLLSLNFK